MAELWSMRLETMRLVLPGRLMDKHHLQRANRQWIAICCILLKSFRFGGQQIFGKYSGPLAPFSVHLQRGEIRHSELKATLESAYLYRARIPLNAMCVLDRNSRVNFIRFSGKLEALISSLPGLKGPLFWVRLGCDVLTANRITEQVQSDQLVPTIRLHKQAGRIGNVCKPCYNLLQATRQIFIHTFYTFQPCGAVRDAVRTLR